MYAAVENRAESIGRVWKYGDNVNTDVIFPGKYTYTVMELAKMGNHALEGLDERFVKQSVPGDVIIAGANWGCGSSREQAVKCLKARGIKAIVAKSFSRIYFRNAINVGLPAIVCPECTDKLTDGDPVSIDITKSEIHSAGRIWTFSPFPDFLLQILEAGGLLPYIKLCHGNANKGA